MLLITLSLAHVTRMGKENGYRMMARFHLRDRGRSRVISKGQNPLQHKKGFALTPLVIATMCGPMNLVKHVQAKGVKVSVACR